MPVTDAYTPVRMDPVRSGSSTGSGSRARAAAARATSRAGGAAERVNRDDLEARIAEARQAERSHLAQEVHDGPAQALSNAIFQVDYLERMSERDPAVIGGSCRLPAPPAPIASWMRSGRSSASCDRRSSTSSVWTARSPRPSDRITSTDRPRDRVGPRRVARAARRGPADGGPARGAGSAAECTEARSGFGRHRVDRRSTTETWVLTIRDDGQRLRHRSGRRPRAAELRAPIHERARRTDRCLASRCTHDRTAGRSCGSRSR